MKTIQVSDELWNEIARLIAADILKQAARPIEAAEESNRENLSSIPPRHFTRGPRLADRQQSVRLINNKFEVSYPEDGILQTWNLPSKNDKEGIRVVVNEALAFGEHHGASEGQLKAIRKALTDNGYYLIGPRRSRPRSRGGTMIKGFRRLSPEDQEAIKGKTAEEISEFLANLPTLGH
jgi:hypothetical protein